MADTPGRPRMQSLSKGLHQKHVFYAPEGYG